MGKKIKTNKAMAKRIKVTKTGKLMHYKCWKSHLLMNKGKAPKRYKYWKELSKREYKKVEALILYNLR
jgi:large subunit ribosomal protein L35